MKVKWDYVDSITGPVVMILSKLWETVGGGGAWRAAVHGAKESQMRLSNLATNNDNKGQKAWPGACHIHVLGQGGLACCNSWGRKESDATE